MDAKWTIIIVPDLLMISYVLVCWVQCYFEWWNSHTPIRTMRSTYVTPLTKHNVSSQRIWENATEQLDILNILKMNTNLIRGRLSGETKDALNFTLAEKHKIHSVYPPHGLRGASLPREEQCQCIHAHWSVFIIKKQCNGLATHIVQRDAVVHAWWVVLLRYCL